MKKREMFWLFLALATLVLRWVAHPAFIERFYSRGWFQGIRVLIDFGLGWMPIPLIYLFFGGLIWYWVRTWRRRPRNRKLLVTGLRTGSRVLSGISMLIVGFFWLWGFNYGRTQVEKTLDLDTHPLTPDEIESEMRTTALEMAARRAAIPNVGEDALTRENFPQHLETHLRDGLEKVLSRYQYPVMGRVRARLLYPKGIFLRFSSSGLYFPYTGQGHIDAGLNAIQWPYTMSHEMAHGYGFGDEGVCNFWAYLACALDDDPAVSYSGQLAYYRSLAANFLSYKPDAYRAFRDSLPQGIQADLDAINQNLLDYPDIMPRARDAAYTAYLKAQGIREGMLNYNRVLMLVKAWKEKEQIRNIME